MRCSWYLKIRVWTASWGCIGSIALVLLSIKSVLLLYIFMDISRIIFLPTCLLRTLPSSNFVVVPTALSRRIYIHRSNVLRVSKGLVYVLFEDTHCFGELLLVCALSMTLENVIFMPSVLSLKAVPVLLLVVLPLLFLPRFPRPRPLPPRPRPLRARPADGVCSVPPSLAVGLQGVSFALTFQVRGSSRLALFCLRSLLELECDLRRVNLHDRSCSRLRWPWV
jgi:hypothetical protein